MNQLELYPIPEPTSRVSLTSRLPDWLSPVLTAEVRAHLAKGGASIRFRFSRGERRIMRRRRPIPVSEWAEKYRVLEMSSIPGRWKNIFTPYLVGIMDAAGTPGVETVIVCKTPQTGGSEAGHNLVGWCIDRSPGPVMYVFPDEITARKNAKDRIIPMITASPRLRETMTGNSDDASSLRVNLTHMPIYLGWSGSVSRLGNKPIRTLILDELDKYKDPKNEATSEMLAEKRTTTWRTRRHILKISTPTIEDGILALCDDRPRGAVPGSVEGKERVSCLLAAVDTQQNYFRYVIRAFGYGDTEESWLVQAGSADSFVALEEILFGSVYRDPDGKEYSVGFAMIDAMGGRTAEVYRWAIAHRGRVMPWQGVRSLAQPWTPSHQEYIPDVKGNKIKIPGGMMLYRCDVTFFKSDLSFKLSINPNDPGAFHLHTGDNGLLEQYAREMCAEVWDDEKQGWENPAGKANHFWDCETMLRALSFILNIRHKRRPDEKPRKPSRPPRPVERGGTDANPADIRRF